MSILNDKKIEYSVKLDNLMRERQEKINYAVNEYKHKLESAPYDKEISDTMQVLEALNKVIAYEDNTETNSVIKIHEDDIVSEIEEVDEIPENAEVVDAVEIIPAEAKTPEVSLESIVHVDNNSGRPGMSTICMPERS